MLRQQDIHTSNATGPFIVERPKVLYNEMTKLYVMWFHLDTPGYGLRQAGVATSPNATGPFQFVRGASYGWNFKRRVYFCFTLPKLRRS